VSKVTSIGPWLPQKAIDVAFGAAPAVAEVRAFDFLAPPRLPRERRGAIDGVLERLSPALASLLTARLRKAVEVVPAAAEVVRAGDLTNALSSPSAAWSFPVGGAIGIADLSLPFALHYIERTFGGTGEPQMFERPLTPLEQNALAAVVGTVPALLAQAFRLPAIGPQHGAYESDPASLPLPARDQAMLVLRFDVRSAGLECTWTFGLPLAELESLFVTPDDALSAPQASAENARGLQQAHVAMVARLPLFRVSARELSGLAPGDSLPCGHPVETQAEVLVNGRIRFRGVVGQVRGRLGLRITETVATPTSARPARDREGRAL